MKNKYIGLFIFYIINNLIKMNPDLKDLNGNIIKPLHQFIQEQMNKHALPKKTLITFEVKPLDETVDLEMLWNLIISRKQEGLQWGENFFLVPIFGTLNKLVMSCTIHDNLVDFDDVTEPIEIMDEYVQSVDIISSNKI